MLSPPAVTNLKTAPVDGNENDDTTTITYASNATINTDGHQQKQQQQKHPQRKCFQCGQVGHQTANCTSSTRNQEGIEAFEEYLEEIEKRRQQYSFKKKHKHKQTQRRTKKFNHLKKIQSWWTDNNVSRCTSMTNEEHNNVSPSAVQNVVVEQKHKHETNNDPIQQVYDSKNFELIKSLHQSYGELFNDVMERVQERFEKGTKELLQQQQQHNHDKNNTGDSPSSSSSPFLKEQEKEEGQDHQSIWQEALNTAVRNGEPADFSNHDDNWVYAQYKLVSRTRYLHHLILDHDNDISKEIRQKLSLSSSCASGRDSTATAVQVCSVGGGPGYDHLAICLVSWYLYQIQKTTHGQEMSQKERKIEGSPIPGRLPRQILTQIFDLYNEEWNSIMEHLQFCFQQETAMVKATDSSNGEWEWWQGNQMTMNFGDLRCANNGVGNNNGNEEAEVENENINSSRMMKSCLCSADLIVFSFVLHENSSFLLVQEHNGDYELGGVLKVMLESAKKDAIVICMDSGNTLWPSFRKTALQYGWNVMSDAQKSHKIILGPKSFCLMKRVQICNPNEM